MNFKACRLMITLLLGMTPGVCAAQGFSADVIYVSTSKPDVPTKGTGTSPHPPSKLYVSKDQMRLETRGLTDTILLVNEGEYSVVALFPVQKAYQPLPVAPSEYFRVVNADDACSDWQKAAKQKIVCEKVGHELVDGRETVKYQNKGASDDATAAVWIDMALKFVVKWEGVRMCAELHNIKEAQQAADLFAVPSNYKILKPQKSTSKGFSQRSR